MLALLSGPFLKIGGIALAALAVFGCIYWAMSQHDAKVLAQGQVSTLQGEMVQIRAQAAKNEVALNENLKAVQARSAAQQHIRERIALAPITSACSQSPAIRGALDGMRPAQPSPPTAAAGPSGAPAVRARTGPYGP